jgi:hypothetical protein
MMRHQQTIHLSNHPFHEVNHFTNKHTSIHPEFSPSVRPSIIKYLNTKTLLRESPAAPRGWCSTARTRRAPPLPTTADHRPRRRCGGARVHGRRRPVRCCHRTITAPYWSRPRARSGPRPVGPGEMCIPVRRECHGRRTATTWAGGFDVVVVADLFVADVFVVVVVAMIVAKCRRCRPRCRRPVADDADPSSAMSSTRRTGWNNCNT